MTHIDYCWHCDIPTKHNGQWCCKCGKSEYAEPVSQIAIMCPDEECCGCLTEKIVGAPECNECGKKYKLVGASVTENIDPAYEQAVADGQVKFKAEKV